jgi:IS4 transposase
VLRSCFPDQWVRALARETGFLKRQRKVDVVAFFWTLVLGFGTGLHRTLAELRRAYEASTGTMLVPSAFYDRFQPELCRFLRGAVAHACRTMAEPFEELKGRLASFTDLVLADATVLRLHDLLEKAYQACRTNHTKAAMKLYLVLSVLAVSPRCVQLAPERTHDSRLLRLGPWVQNRLLLIDMAHFYYQLLDRVDRNGGFFIIRVKDNANPLIVAEHLRLRGQKVPLVGARLRDVLTRLQRGVLDVEVEVPVTRRVYRGRRRRDWRTFRLVGILNPDTREYHLYLTNIPPDRLEAQDVARTYKARWEVELVFKELKSHYRLDDLPSSHRPVVEALVYTAILTLVISRAILTALRRAGGIAATRSPERRWAAALHTVAGLILRLLCDPLPRRSEWAALQSYLLHEFLDPNVNRARNLGVCRA